MKSTYIVPETIVENVYMDVYLLDYSIGGNQSGNNSGIETTKGGWNDFEAKENFGGEWETF